MKKYFFSFSLSVFIASCNNTHNTNMNNLLSMKKQIEIKLDSNKARDNRYRDITGYDEIYDSITLDKQYPHPDLVDSIWTLKSEKILLTNELEKIRYSVDSLEKLK